MTRADTAPRVPITPPNIFKTSSPDVLALTMLNRGVIINNIKAPATATVQEE
jgi:hypothetical protein